jgi:hypothetical protein
VRNWPSRLSSNCAMSGRVRERGGETKGGREEGTGAVGVALASVVGVGRREALAPVCWSEWRSRRLLAPVVGKL